MQTDEPEINKERLTVKNLTVGMLRALFEDEKADEKIKKFDVNYFHSTVTKCIKVSTFY